MANQQLSYPLSSGGDDPAYNRFNYLDRNIAYLFVPDWACFSRYAPKSIEVVHATEILELIDVAPMTAIAVDQLDEQTTPLNALPPTIDEDEEDPTVALAISYNAAVTQIRQMEMPYVLLVEKPDLSADSRALKKKAIVLLLMDDTWVVVELYEHFPLVGWCVKMIPIGNYIRKIVLDEAEYGTTWILATRLNK